MRVLYWTELFWPYVGGVEVLSSRLLPALRDRGVTFQVLTSHGALDLPDEEEWEGIPIRRIRLHEGLATGDVELLAAARREVVGLKRAFAPDLVHLNVTAAGVWFELRTRTAHPCPLLLSVRVALPEDGGGPDTLLGAALASAAWITANSQAIGDDLRALAPAATDRISVIPNGLEVPDVEPAPLPVDAPRIVCVGRLVDDKGFDVALEAFAAVLERFPSARLLVAGDGPAREALVAQAADLGIARSVRFCGWVTPELVPELMNRATVVVMPSRWREAFGLVALQAALMARPVIATRVGGLPEVVADGETGILVGVEDADALAAALWALLADPAGARAMGARARRRALEQFGFDRHIDAYAELYNRLAA
jgi:glycosyltransferase involved in cell wall biosynthesis